MQADDIETSFLVKLAIRASKTKMGLRFKKHVLTNKVEFDFALETANKFYRLLRREMGIREENKQQLNIGDQSIFTYLLISVAIAESYHMFNVSECQNALKMTILGFETYNESAQIRMAKCLLEAKKQIETHS